MVLESTSAGKTGVRKSLMVVSGGCVAAPVEKVETLGLGVRDVVTDLLVCGGALFE